MTPSLILGLIYQALNYFYKQPQVTAKNLLVCVSCKTKFEHILAAGQMASYCLKNILV